MSASEQCQPHRQMFIPIPPHDFATRLHIYDTIYRHCPTKIDRWLYGYRAFDSSISEALLTVRGFATFVHGSLVSFFACYDTTSYRHTPVLRSDISHRYSVNPSMRTCWHVWCMRKCTVVRMKGAIDSM